MLLPSFFNYHIVVSLWHPSTYLSLYLVQTHHQHYPSSPSPPLLGFFFPPKKSACITVLCLESSGSVLRTGVVQRHGSLAPVLCRVSTGLHKAVDDYNPTSSVYKGSPFSHILFAVIFLGDSHCSDGWRAILFQIFVFPFLHHYAWSNFFKKKSNWLVKWEHSEAEGTSEVEFRTQAKVQARSRAQLAAFISYFTAVQQNMVCECCTGVWILGCEHHLIKNL